jgi:hypothetical protein
MASHVEVRGLHLALSTQSAAFVQAAPTGSFGAHAPRMHASGVKQPRSFASQDAPSVEGIAWHVFGIPVQATPRSQRTALPSHASPTAATRPAVHTCASCGGAVQGHAAPSTHSSLSHRSPIAIRGAHVPQLKPATVEPPMHRPLVH